MQSDSTATEPTVKHTAGPWAMREASGCLIEIDSISYRGDVAFIDAPGWTAIATVATGGGCRDEKSTANARLMAAAPDLLACLRALLHACYEADRHEELSALVDGALLDAAHAAIAKAEGRA